MLCIASNTCTASVVEICSSDAVITTVVLIYEIQEVGENKTFFVNTWTTVCWKIHFPAKDRLGLTKSISFADPFSQKVEGYEATGVNAKRSRGTFAGVKGHVATF